MPVESLKIATEPGLLRNDEKIYLNFDCLTTNFTTSNDPFSRAVVLDIFQLI